jgi:2-polyprenyl-3-methyl-5-hydroxy-6-metoxy-1,4-benzoquinol methylase
MGRQTETGTLGARFVEDERAVELARRYLSAADNRAVYERSTRRAHGRNIDERARNFLRDALAWHSTDWSMFGREVEALLGGRPDRVLDAGCGMGNGTMVLAERYPDAEVVGLDIEEDATELADHLAQRFFPNIQIVRGALESFADRKGFDLIVCRGVLEHVVEPPRVARQLVRLLRPRGVLFVSTPNYIFPREPHMGLWTLPFCPRRVLQAQCWLTGRDSSFLDHLHLEVHALSVRRWVRSAGVAVVVEDLMAKRMRAMFGARSTIEPLERSRRHLVRVVRSVRGLGPVLVAAIRALALEPSTLLLVRREE